MNPNVVVNADPNPLDKKPDSFFINFDVVCLIDCSIEQILRVNRICRENKIKFFAADVFGFFGFVFEDLLKHEYARFVFMIMLNSFLSYGIEILVFRFVSSPEVHPH